jgi:hypothetical protein
VTVLGGPNPVAGVKTGELARAGFVAGRCRAVVELEPALWTFALPDRHDISRTLAPTPPGS